MESSRAVLAHPALAAPMDACVVYGITGIRLQDGQVAEVMMGMIDPTLEHWDHRPAPTRLVEVVDRLVEGDTVVTLFPTERGTLELGSEVQVDVLGDGVETLALVDDHPGRRLVDLPRF